MLNILTLFLLLFSGLSWADRQNVICLKHLLELETSSEDRLQVFRKRMFDVDAAYGNDSRPSIQELVRELADSTRFYALEAFRYRLSLANSQRDNYERVFRQTSGYESLSDWLQSINLKKITKEQIEILENVSVKIYDETGENPIRLGMLVMRAPGYVTRLFLEQMRPKPSTTAWGYNKYDNIFDVRLEKTKNKYVHWDRSEWTNELADKVIGPHREILKSYVNKHNIDIVVAVPSSSGKLGISTRIGRAVAKSVRLPFQDDWLRNANRFRDEQKEIDDLWERIKNTVDTFAIDPIVKGRNVLIVDDTNNYGITMEEARRIAFDMGASNVYTLSLASLNDYW